MPTLKALEKILLEKRKLSRAKGHRDPVAWAELQAAAFAYQEAAPETKRKPKAGKPVDRFKEGR